MLDCFPPQKIGCQCSLPQINPSQKSFQRSDNTDSIYIIILQCLLKHRLFGHKYFHSPQSVCTVHCALAVHPASIALRPPFPWILSAAMLKASVGPKVKSLSIVGSFSASSQFLFMKILQPAQNCLHPPSPPRLSTWPKYFSASLRVFSPVEKNV